MKEKLYRFIAVALLFALLIPLTGCLGAMTNENMPKPDATESPAPQIEYAERKLIFRRNVSAIQVNTDMPLGYFCYEDNPNRILTENSKTDAADDSIEYSLKIKKEDGSYASSDEYKSEIKENGFVYLNSKVLGSVELSAKCANGKSADAETMPIKRQSGSIFDAILLLAGAYLIFSGIIGKGKIYESEFVKKGMEEKRRGIIRIACFVLGALMIAGALITFLDGYGKLKTVKLAVFAFTLLSFIVISILLRPCTDQEKKRKAQMGGSSAVSSPAAAFIFDEDEPTLDDIKNNK